MQDHEPRRPGEPEVTSELKIHLPTAASAAKGASGAGEAGSGTPGDAAGADGPEEAASRKVVGRSLAERLADPDPGGTETGEPRTTGTFALPDWSDPPTGLVPRVLLDEAELAGAEGDLVDTGMRGPSWREEGSDWDNDTDLGFLGIDEPEEGPLTVAGRVEPAGDPYDLGFDDLELGPVVPPAPPAFTVHDERWDAVFDDRSRPATGASGPVGEVAGAGPVPDPEPERHRARHRRQHGAVATEGRSAAVATEGRSAAVATAVGLGVGALAALCFWAGPLATLALVVVAITLAAAELFFSLQRAGYRPATLIGLVAIPLMVVGSYLHGAISIATVLAALMAAFAVWSVAGLVQKDPLVNLGVTALVVSWTGVLGSFAGMLLNGTAFPHRHGVAFVLGAVVLTVAHDVGSYAVGARLGRHPLAPAVSPGKTREGLVGGSVLVLVVAVAIVAHIHPFSLLAAICLGLVVIVVAPLGDLFESVAKRDLGLKDMGRILPAHGGIFDRIDAMLFVLPACYLLVRAFNLG